VVSWHDVLAQDSLLLTKVLDSPYNQSATDRLQAANAASDAVAEELGSWPFALADSGISAAGQGVFDKLMHAFTVQRGWDVDNGIVTLLLQRKTGAEGVSPRSRTFCPFPSGSTIVSAWFDHSLRVFNTAHPLLQELSRVAAKDPDLATRVYKDLCYPSSDLPRSAETLLAAAKRDGSTSLHDLAQQLKAVPFMEAHHMTIHLATT
jgi:hypothetical protein